jgi:glycosyltransferase involved in cell wall biosynthesis
MRILALMAARSKVLPRGELPPIDSMRQMERDDTYPRTMYFADELGGDVADEEFLAKAPRIRRLLYCALPVFVAQVIEAYAMRRRYDVVITWGERLTLLYALLQLLTLDRTPHVAMMYWISPPKKALFLRLTQARITRILMWSQAQRDFAVRQLRIPAAKVTLIPYFVDQHFWRPQQIPSDQITAAGDEMRDYTTLIAAMQGLNLPCEVIASRRKLSSETQAMVDEGRLPAGVSIHNASYTELRDAYARSRFVVVPLKPSDTNHGLIVILEAMAMGKPVICSRVRGHTDIIQDGVTGVFVEQGDAEALRAAIERLWNDPRQAERMGAAARRYIEERHCLEDFVAHVKDAVEQTVAQRGALPASGLRA